MAMPIRIGYAGYGKKFCCRDTVISKHAKFADTPVLGCFFYFFHFSVVGVRALTYIYKSFFSITDIEPIKKGALSLSLTLFL